ncbi:hypothetical protein Poly51_25780 [Rubripirellula tenax]|uniref:Uncharacterized protein n=1 Tax=Rubripirellula tenax TaxID=2528015 RepID=A0A5C6FAS3_9BACT|nr:hypothetical protein [Rubripirellula tenax]TWU56661.1 hypothetical protein Poly51_25780 [Rubripirellula tenax]
MKAATISQLKKTLVKLDHDALLDACLRLAKSKVDNKELLTYVLMKSVDEPAYVAEVCDEIDEQIPAAKTIHKKTLRKIVRVMDKRIRHSGDRETELQIRIYFCRQFVDRGIRFGNCRVSANMYASQLKKIEKAIERVHPDLQFDFRQDMRGLDTWIR